MEKPDFQNLGLSAGEASAQAILDRMKEWVDYLQANPDGDLTMNEVHKAVRGIMLMGAGITAMIEGSTSVSMILGELAGEAMLGEIHVAEQARAAQARLN